MKKHILFLLSFLAITTLVHSQTPYDNMVECKQALQSKMEEENKITENSYYGTAIFAVECGMSIHKCIAHKALCCVPCWKNYQAKLQQIEDRYDAAFAVCDEAYNSQIAAQSAKEEQERLAEEEKRQKAAKEKKEQEEKAEQEKKEKEKKKSSSDDEDNTKANKEKKEQKSWEEQEAESKLRYQQSRMEYHRQQKELQNAESNRAAVNMASGIAGAADAIGNIQDNLSDGNYFQGASTNLGFHLGLISPNAPLITTEFVNYTNPKSNIQSPFQLGINAGLKCHPIVTKYVSINLAGNFTAALDPIGWLSGDGSSTTSTSAGSTDVSNTSSSTTVNFDFGGEIAVGAAMVKLLGGWYYKNYSLSHSEEGVIDTYSGINTTTTTTSVLGSVSYIAHRYELGIRLGSYEGTLFDLIYGLESFTDYDGSQKRFPVYKLNIWKFSGFRFFAEYGEGIAYGPMEYALAKPEKEDKKGIYINAGIVYNIDWLWKW